jgi:hypothetical protein
MMAALLAHFGALEELFVKGDGVVQRGLQSRIALARLGQEHHLVEGVGEVVVQRRGVAVEARAVARED